MSADIWFYTFSTSAQVMAALVGLFAVFVVYKIQEFSSTLNEVRNAINRIIDYSSANTKDYQPILMRELILMSDSEVLTKFSELLEIKHNEPRKISASMTLSGEAKDYALDDSTRDFYERLTTRKRSIMSQLKKILILCLMAIALSLASLVMTKFLILCSWFTWITLIFFLYCLYVIGRGIYSIAIG